LRSPPQPISTLFPYTTLFRSHEPALAILDLLALVQVHEHDFAAGQTAHLAAIGLLMKHQGHILTALNPIVHMPPPPKGAIHVARSEEHTSELQSLRHLVCRLL